MGGKKQLFHLECIQLVNTDRRNAGERFVLAVTAETRAEAISWAQHFVDSATGRQLRKVN